MRREFSKKVRKQAWNRCGGFCEGTRNGERCGAKLFPRRFTFDHDKPDAFGGEPTLENCRVLCEACDDTKTYDVDIPAIAKADRIREKHLGLRKPKRKMAYRRFNGERVYPK